MKGHHVPFPSDDALYQFQSIRPGTRSLLLDLNCSGPGARGPARVNVEPVPWHYRAALVSVELVQFGVMLPAFGGPGKVSEPCQCEFSGEEEGAAGACPLKLCSFVGCPTG